MEATIRAHVSWMVRNSQQGGVGDTFHATEGNVKEAATVKISTKVKTTRIELPYGPALPLLGIYS